MTKPETMQSRDGKTWEPAVRPAFDDLPGMWDSADLIGGATDAIPSDDESVETLRMVLDGRISGRISEWPQLKPAIANLLRRLSRREGDGSLRIVAKRNLESLIRIGSNDKELMLKCLEELS